MATCWFPGQPGHAPFDSTPQPEDLTVSLTAEQLMQQRENDREELRLANSRDAARLALWDEMRAALTEFVVLNRMHGYEFESNEPEWYKAAVAIIAKCNAIDPPK